MKYASDIEVRIIMQEKKEMNRRIDEIDIVKAFGIIFMVAGHASAPFTDFIHLFHMSIFIIASGMFFKNKSSINFRETVYFIWKKIKQLWLPFFLWNMIFVLLHNFFIRINVYTDNPLFLQYSYSSYGLMKKYTIKTIFKEICMGFLFSGGEQLGSAMWFLKILFMVSCLYCVINYLLNLFIKNNIFIFQLIISTVFLWLGYFCFSRGITLKGFAHTFSMYFLYFLGTIFKDKIHFFNRLSGKIYVLLIIISFLILEFLKRFGVVNLSINSYVNPLFLIVTSIVGWLFTYSMAFFCMKINILRFILICIGKNTLIIMILHYLLMKIVTLFIILIYHYPLYCLAAFPNLEGGIHCRWIAYTLVVIVLSISINYLYHFFVNLVMRNFKKMKLVTESI